MTEDSKNKKSTDAIKTVSISYELYKSLMAYVKEQAEMEIRNFDFFKELNFVVGKRNQLLVHEDAKKIYDSMLKEQAVINEELKRNIDEWCSREMFCISYPKKASSTYLMIENLNNIAKAGYQPVIQWFEEDNVFVVYRRNQ